MNPKAEIYSQAYAPQKNQFVLADSSRNLFNGWEYILIIFSVPLIQVIEFYTVQDGQITDSLSRTKSILPYLNFVLFLVAIIKSRFAWIQLLLLCYIFFYIFNYDFFSVQNNASYMMPFVVTCSYFFLPLDHEVEFTKLQENLLLAFFLVFIAVYYLVAKEKLFEDRFYLVGFVIPHQFSYYCAILTFYYFDKNRVFLALLISFAGVYVGVRSGLLAIIFCYIYYLPKIWNQYKRKSLLIGAVAILGTIIVLQFVDESHSENKIEALLNQTFNVKNKNTDYSSERSELWSNVYEYASRTFYSPETIIGHGPKSSYVFNQNTLGIDIWMHNDFVEIFFTLGFLGLLLYLNSLYRFFKRTGVIAFIIFILILIGTNGYFTYIPVTMIMFFRLIFSNKEKNESYAIQNGE